MGLIKGIFKYSTKIVAGVVGAVIDGSLGTDVSKGMQETIDELFDDNSTRSKNDVLKDFCLDTSSEINNPSGGMRDKVYDEFGKKLKNLTDDQLTHLKTSNFNNTQLDMYRDEKRRRGL